MDAQLYAMPQLMLYIGLLFILTKPMGIYLEKVLDPQGKTFLDPVVQPLERILDRGIRVDPGIEQDWKH
jgi:potassium-transporting ATPase potassium-binding subunit